MKDLTIGVVGGGVVGSAVARSYLEHTKRVMVYDKVKERSTCALGELLNEADITFVCLPTPLGQVGQGLDVSAIDGFFSYVAEGESASDGQRWRDKNFVLRSTVPIGTTRRLAKEYGLPNLVHSPEFLTARTADTDAANPRINLIGFPEGCPGTDEWVDHPLTKLYHARFQYENGSSRLVVPMGSNESETVKLTMNSWFAVKVAFWNEVRTLTDKLGMDYEEIRDAIVWEGRVHKLHTNVPGRDGFGFSGACLPKDLAQFVLELSDNGLRADVTSAAILRNGYDRNGGQS